MEIGLRIRKRREELEMTQEELAKKLGYANRSSVNKVETSREVSMKKIKAYADALETTVPELMGWTDATDIEEKADIHAELFKQNDKILQYAIKLSNLSKEDQEDIMKMIDRFSRG